jgi:pyridoxal phosphate enzyme (YggS family)
MEADHEIKQNYLEVLGRMSQAAGLSNRKVSDITLVAVTKRQPVQKLREYLSAGGRTFGENYPEEGASKRKLLLDLPSEWHMIGHIQSRKAALVAENYDYVHSIDSMKVAEKLQNALSLLNRKLPFLVEINIADEESKYGYRISHADDLSALYIDLDCFLGMQNLVWRGIMVMPPLSSTADKSRVYFAKAKNLLDLLKKRYPDQQADQLSMGTSLDFPIAIEEGATMVRVGTAIFGERV